MKLPLLVAVFEQLHLESGTLEHVPKQPEVIDHLMVGGGMICWAGAADLHRALILGIRKIRVRYGASQPAAGPQKLEAQPGGGASLGLGEVFPHVFA